MRTLSDSTVSVFLFRGVHHLRLELVVDGDGVVGVDDVADGGEIRCPPLR